MSDDKVSYRNCPVCGDLFAPITSDAEDRYSFCSPECEEEHEADEYER